MRLSTAAVAACCASALAFSNTSPFLMFSTSKFTDLIYQEQLQSSSQVLSSAKEILSTCPTKHYLLVSQPDLNVGHLTQHAAPKLRSSLESKDVQGRFSVAEVAGGVDVVELSSYIKEACQGKSLLVEAVELDAIASTKTVQENDADLGVALGQYEAEGSYTIIYTAGSHGIVQVGEPGRYDAGFQDMIHMELKRQLASLRKRVEDSTKLKMFEKYQFFTPGIFMGLLALFVLLSILGVGISAIASLQVSYGAFDKEMGPAAQKKT